MNIGVANLLINIESFHWDDLELDKTKLIEDLAMGVNSAESHGDLIYGHPDCYNFKLKWGYFHDLLAFDEEERKIFTGWLTQRHQKFLIKLWRRQGINNSVSNISDLMREFPQSNNGLIGCKIDIPVQYLVYDLISWKKLHHVFVKSNPSLRYSHCDYFYKFYIPELNVPPNQINIIIVKGQAHPIFKRLDTPTQIDTDNTMHGEQIQIHFNDPDGSALNINGKWKHGGFDIPREARNQLIEWGFLLPDEC